MAVLALPRRSAPVVLLASGLSLGLAAWFAFEVRPAWWMWPLIFVLSGFLADALTGLAHFGFDYVFPWDMPILGPISREFNEHHEAPALDPGNIVDNLTKGAYASLLASAIALSLAPVLPGSPAGDVAFGVAVALSGWTLLFHQMHSYAHMGSVLPSEVFRARVADIAQMPDLGARKRALRALFREVPIPPGLRFLQTVGLTLNPERHNLHHIDFESDFSSVNGWSDPVLNPVLGPLARWCKARRAAKAAVEA
jgi:hypothetical protein